MVETLIVIAADGRRFSNPQNRQHCVGGEFTWQIDRLVIRLSAVGALLMSTILGCQDSNEDKALPAPIREQVEHVAVGRIPRAQGGDQFEFWESDIIHSVTIRGVDCPQPGQKFYREARGFLWKMTRKQLVRIEVVDREESMIEIADAFVINADPADIEGDLNIGLALLRKGLGWFDGTEFENSELYQQAELEARTNKIGLWSQLDPIPPGEFESAKQAELVEQLKF